MNVSPLSKTEKRRLTIQLKACHGSIHHNYVEDIVGFRFGDLVVLRELAKIKRTRIYECLCDCGTLIQVKRNDLTQGHKRNCGTKGNHAIHDRARKS